MTVVQSYYYDELRSFEGSTTARPTGRLSLGFGYD